MTYHLLSNLLWRQRQRLRWWRHNYHTYEYEKDKNFLQCSQRLNLRGSQFSSFAIDFFASKFSLSLDFFSLCQTKLSNFSCKWINVGKNYKTEYFFFFHAESRSCGQQTTTWSGLVECIAQIQSKQTFRVIIVFIFFSWSLGRTFTRRKEISWVKS